MPRLLFIVSFFMSFMALMLSPATAQRQGLIGDYVGVGLADGMSVTLRPTGGGYVGALVGANGQTYSIQARANGEKAEGELEHGDGAAFFRFAPHPAGLIMVWLPYDANRQPQANRVRSLPFVIRGADIPTPPPTVAEPPQYYGDRVDELEFLANYAFWEAEDVAEGYGAARDKYRALIELFPGVQADILWKLCQAPVASPAATAVAQGLRGQNVTCDEVLRAFEAGRANGRFNEFKRRVESESGDLVNAIKCARGMGRAAECRSVARRTSDYATSMDTVASVIRALR